MSQETRQRILDKNFEAMHKHGFQGMRTDKVVQELGITKGAFYHYFQSKQELGYALVDEKLAPMYLHPWKEWPAKPGNPVEQIVELIRFLSDMQNEDLIKLGCPLNNLIQEMAPLDEGFRLRLGRIVEGMQAGIREALLRGQREGSVRTDTDAADAAVFIVSAMEGAFGIAKAQQSLAIFRQAVRQLTAYVRSLAA
ncbi:MAG: TetR/AcrR family transcriptional regulator [Bacteroidia bacterium]|nr:TetR/AcrR family transcriptional regulator [Bacteroidia bacterium]